MYTKENRDPAWWHAATGPPRCMPSIADQSSVMSHDHACTVKIRKVCIIKLKYVIVGIYTVNLHGI